MVKVKICGLKDPEHLAASIDYGADYVGFVLTPGYRRSITKSELCRLNADIGIPIPRVGVFVNPDPMEVRDYFEDGLIDIAQFHGQEQAQLLSLFPIQKVWKAIHAGIDGDYFADILVVDSDSPGSGQVCDWDKITYSDRKIMLAGGLHPDNVAAAIARVHPYGVDVSSGVEISPGIKSVEKIKSFLRSVKL